MEYRLLLPPKKKLIFHDGSVKNTGDTNASLNFKGFPPSLREDMLTRLNADSPPLEQFKHAAEEYYLRRLEKGAFIEAALRLAKSSKEVKNIVPDVADKFDSDQGFEAIQIIHQAIRRAP